MAFPRVVGLLTQAPRPAVASAEQQQFVEYEKNSGGSNATSSGSGGYDPLGQRPLDRLQLLYGGDSF